MSKTASLPHTGTKKILIVEDEGEMCLLLNIIIDQKDIELDHVQNIRAATEYMEKHTPDVVILDNKLPDGFGVDFIDYIKKEFPEAGIIMMSGYDSSVREVALHNGANVYLQKPFTRDQIEEAIDGLIKKK